MKLRKIKPNWHLICLGMSKTTRRASMGMHVTKRRQGKMHSLLNETGDLFTQDGEKTVRMPASPQPFTRKTDFQKSQVPETRESLSEKT